MDKNSAPVRAAIADPYSANHRRNPRCRPSRRLCALVFEASSRLCGSVVAAEAAGDLLALPLEQLLNLKVFSASKFAQKAIDAASTVSTITAADIKAYGYRSLADILRSVRGLYVSYERNYEYLGARGCSRPGDYNTRVLLLLDGQRLNDGVFDQAPIGKDFSRRRRSDRASGVRAWAGFGCLWRQCLLWRSQRHHQERRESRRSARLGRVRELPQRQSHAEIRAPLRQWRRPAAVGLRRRQHNLFDKRYRDPASEEHVDSLGRRLEGIEQDGHNFRVKLGYEF